MLKGLDITNDNLVAAQQHALEGQQAVGEAPFNVDLPQRNLPGRELLELLRQFPGFLCVVEGPERIIAFTNDAFREFLSDDLTGVPFSAAGTALWPGLSGQIERAFATGEAGHVRRVLLSKKSVPDTSCFVDFAVQPILCDGDRVLVVLQGTDVTEQVRIETALHASNDRAESIIDAVGDGFVAFDEDFRVLKINAAALAYDGRQEHEILGKTHWEAWPTSAGSFLEGEYQRCLDEQVQISIERRYLGFGKDRWLELRLCPVLGGIVSFYCDVTDTKNADAALRASEERFRALVEAVPHLVWEAGPKGHVEWFNGRYADYVGTTLDDLTESAWERVVHPDDYTAVIEAWNLALREGSVFESEIRLRRQADGAYRWFLSKGVPVRSADGVVMRWIGTNTDIHDEKAAAHELTRLNSQLEERVEESIRDRQRMWQLSTDLMVVTTFDGTIVAANPAWQMALGWSETELQGSRFLNLTHPGERAQVEAEIAEIFVEGSSCTLPVQLQHKDGSYRWIAWTGVPDESFIHAVGRDITAEKIASNALQVTEEALRQSQKMEAVGQLTGGIAHDFNNLLTGVIGSLDLLKTRIAQGREGEAGRYIDAAMSSANRAAALTHRLLAFSRRQPLDPRPVKVDQLVASMDELFRRTISEAIHVEFTAKDDMWLTLCDSNQLESALLNLVINARDAMNDGGAILIQSANIRHDHAHPSSPADLLAGDYVLLSVTDTGSGMPRDVIERAFEPFFTTKPIGQGTGLGLSMVYGFVAQSGGHVTISSEPHNGTNVSIYLPRYIGEAEHDEPVPADIPKLSANADEVVLVVEDETVVRSLVIDILADLGYRVLDAQDGPSALTILQSPQRIDLLLTDVGLPGLNGRQLADAARDWRPDLKVLFMTGYVENKLLADGFLGPRMEVIAKPFAGEALAMKVAHMIHGQHRESGRRLSGH